MMTVEQYIAHNVNALYAICGALCFLPCLVNHIFKR